MDRGLGAARYYGYGFIVTSICFRPLFHFHGIFVTAKLNQTVTSNLFFFELYLFLIDL